MWQFQIKFLDKYIKNLILKKRIPAIYIGTFWESIPRNFLDRIPNVLEKIEKSWKKIRIKQFIQCSKSQLISSKWDTGLCLYKQIQEKINKQENVNKQCQTSFLTRKEEQKNPGKNIPGKFQKIPKNSRKL